MAQSYLMTADSFEQQKNMKAGALTAGICVLLALMLLFVSWQLPKIAAPDPPLDQQGIEVNLGTEETGFGDVQPLAVGDPAPETATTSAQPAVPEPTESSAADDAESNVAVPKAEKAKVEPRKPVVTPTPAPPQPKAKMGAITTKNGTGPGGNDSQDDFEKNRSQGIYKGPGKDQGDINGTPNSDRYGPGGGTGNGTPKMSGNLASRGTRYIPKFSTDESWKGTVVVRLVVSPDGDVLTATKEARGTTPTLSQRAINYAIDQAKKIKFKVGSTTENITGTVNIRFEY
jgi:hypothetical protein